MASRATGPLVLIAVFVLGAAGGVGWDRLATRSPANDAAALPDGANAEVVARLSGLERELAKLQATIHEQLISESAGSTSRQPIDAAPPDVARLTQAVEQLDQLLAKLALSNSLPVTARGERESWKGPGFTSMDAMRARAEQLFTAEPEKWGSLAIDEFTTAHMLWSREDVTNQYGAPNRIETGNGLALVYDQSTVTLGQENCWIQFYSQEGVVNLVSVNCK